MCPWGAPRTGAGRSEAVCAGRFNARAKRDTSAVEAARTAPSSEQGDVKMADKRPVGGDLLHTCERASKGGDRLFQLQSAVGQARQHEALVRENAPLEQLLLQECPHEHPL